MLDMQHAIILNICTHANVYRIHIAPNHCVAPNARMRANCNLSNNLRAIMHVTGLGYMWKV